MTRDEVYGLIQRRAFPLGKGKPEFIETHISWVILLEDYVYKIKRPVTFSFLDFSDPLVRKEMLIKELVLNRRLVPNVYLEVLPVHRTSSGPEITKGSVEAVDHALLMRRMDDSRQLDRLLQGRDVSNEDMERLAKTLADFHITTKKAPEADLAEDLWPEFADVMSVGNTLEHYGLEKQSRLLSSVVTDTKPLIENLQSHLICRFDLGMCVDGHGDLHTRNIILSEEVLIFDCIEFSDEFRWLDVLNEIAFLYVDLEARGHLDLANVFLNTYIQQLACMVGPADKALFAFYKMHRAGVFLKVLAIKAGQQSPSDPSFRQTSQSLTTFLELIFGYFSEFKADLEEDHT